jgi:hypothetical protein
MEVVTIPEIMTANARLYGAIMQNLRVGGIVATIKTSNLTSKPAVQKFFKNL